MESIEHLRDEIQQRDVTAAGKMYAEVCNDLYSNGTGVTRSFAAFAGIIFSQDGINCSHWLNLATGWGTTDIHCH